MTGPPRRILVIDENLDKRLATELNYRGRPAASVAELGLRGAHDPDLLRKLDAQLEDFVLVTADDALPLEHADAVRDVGATIATVNPTIEAGWTLRDWRREVVHRWAHAMHEQEAGTIRRYGLRRQNLWRPARRRRPTS